VRLAILHARQPDSAAAQEYMDTAKLYGDIYGRLVELAGSVLGSSMKDSLKSNFSDKELRVVMSMNNIMINDLSTDGAKLEFWCRRPDTGVRAVA
jgi:hypothetical protein